MNSNDWKEELLAEKNLWQIYVKSRKIRTSTFNLVFLSLTYLLSGAVVAYLPKEFPYSTTIYELSKIGFSAILGIIAFLTAGFSVFAMMGNSNILLEMARTPHEESELSYLKYNFYNFARVFLYFLVGAFLTLGLIIASIPYGPSQVIYNALDLSPGLLLIVKKILFASLICIFCHLLLELKSFTFNIFHIVFTNVRWLAENEEIDSER